MYCVEVTGLSSAATDDDLVQFFTFCGEIQAVQRKQLESGDQTAHVVFNEEDSVATALLLSGAVVADRPVTITSVEASKGTSQESALAFIERVISAGIVKGEAMVKELRARATSLDKDGKVRATVSGGVKSAREIGKDVIGTITGSKPIGKPTDQSWMYGNQPQWGPAPPQQ